MGRSTQVHVRGTDCNAPRLSVCVCWPVLGVFCECFVLAGISSLFFIFLI